MDSEPGGGKHRADYSDAVTDATDPEDSITDDPPVTDAVTDEKVEEPKKRGALREAALLSTLR